MNRKDVESLLLPCPFCGGKATVFQIDCSTNGNKYWTVGCALSNCRGEHSATAGPNLESEIGKWNHRASLQFGGLESFNGDDLIMSATSYYLGRQTISVDAHCQCLIRAWPRLSQGVREYVQRIVEDVFRREVILREMDPDFNPFGDACDRESWVNVRKCWTEKTSG